MKRILTSLGLMAVLAGCGHVAPAVPTEPEECGLAQGLVAGKQEEWRKDEPEAVGTLRLEYCRPVATHKTKSAVGLVISTYIQDGERKEDGFASVFIKDPTAGTWEILRIIPIYSGVVLGSASVSQPNSARTADPTTNQ